MFLLPWFVFAAEAADRQVLLEIYTGSWCALCPDGQVKADAEVAAWGDRLVVVNVHQGDEMSFSPSPIEEMMPDGYPQGSVDRGGVISRGLWASAVAVRMEEPAGVLLEVDPIWNGFTRTALVTVNATYEQAAVHPTRIRLYVIEDDLTGVGPGWDQTNYYDTTEGHPFFGLGNPVLGYSHRRVLRALPVGQIDDGAVAAGIEPGHTETETYEIPVSEEMDEEKLSFVAYVVDATGEFTSQRVWNVVSVPLVSVPELSLAWAGTSETHLDLGDLRVGDSLSRTLIVENTGVAYALLGDLVVDSEDLSVDSDSCSGENLAPQANCEVAITWTAADELDANLSIPFDSGELVATLVGDGDLAPVSQDDSYTVVAGETLEVGSPGVLANDVDPDGGVILPSIVQAVDGLMMGDDGSFTLQTSAEDAGATLTFTYVTEDYVGLGNVATVTVEVTAPEAEDSDGEASDTGCNCQTTGASPHLWGASLVWWARRRKNAQRQN